MNSHARVEQDIDELGRGKKVRLINRDDITAGIAFGRVAEKPAKLLCSTARRLALAAAAASACTAGGLNHLRCDRPIVPAAAVDGALAHPPDVVEELLAMAAGVIKDG